MALISSTNQILAISIFNLTVAYFLLTNPSKLSTHTLTILLSACFQLKYNPPSFSTPTALSSLLAVVLTYVSISDIVGANMHQEIALIHWSAQAPIRTIFFFATAIVSLLSTPEGFGKIAKVLAGGQIIAPASGSGREEGGLSNGIVFVWSFIMAMWWFWAYVTIRDERRELAITKQAKRV